MAKTWTAHHPCPELECDDEIVITYDVGRHYEDFMPVEDEVTCARGHVIRTWGFIDRDADEYADHLLDQMEGARESYYQSKGERY